MNDPLDSLFALARAARPDTSRAEYAFETRLLAHLHAARASGAWGLVAWRLIPVFILVIAGLACWQVQAESASQDALSAQNPAAIDFVNSFD
jgi:hypothetical protein